MNMNEGDELVRDLTRGEGGEAQGLRGVGAWGRAFACVALVMGAVWLPACGGDEGAKDEPAWISPDGGLGGSDDGPKRTTEITPPSAAQGTGPRVLFLGDSLSAGLHLPKDEAFPAVLQARLAAEGAPFELVNAGVSGDTTAGGLARLDWLLKQDPDLVVVELGANDGLRGVALESVEANLRKIVARLQDEDLPVLLLGMKLPPNYGSAYTEGFETVYQRVADDTGVTFVPFFLEGVAGDPTLNLPDGIHPTTAGHERIADNLEPVLRDLVTGLAE